MPALSEIFALNLATLPWLLLIVMGKETPEKEHGEQKVSSHRDWKLKCPGHHRGTLATLIMCGTRTPDAELELASSST